MSGERRCEGWTRDELRKRSDDQLAAISFRVANRVAKWRSVFAGWQLGTRLTSDPECQAVRDHREVTIMLRAEVNALTKCLVDAGLLSSRDFTEHVIVELEHLDAEYAKRFPGFRSTDSGISIDPLLARETMRGWRP